MKKRRILTVSGGKTTVSDRKTQVIYLFSQQKNLEIHRKQMAELANITNIANINGRKFTTEVWEEQYVMTDSGWQEYNCYLEIGRRPIDRAFEKEQSSRKQTNKEQINNDVPADAEKVAAGKRLTSTKLINGRFAIIKPSGELRQITDRITWKRYEDLHLNGQLLGVLKN